MKNARPINDEAGAPGTGTRIIAIGSHPTKQTTVTAEVRVRLLAGEKLKNLQTLIVRLTGLGMTPKLATLTLAEAWGLYLFLRQLAEGR